MPLILEPLQDVEEWDQPLPALFQPNFNFDRQLGAFDEQLASASRRDYTEQSANRTAAKIFRLAFTRIRWISGVAVSQQTSQTRRNAVLAIANILDTVVECVAMSDVCTHVQRLFREHDWFVAEFIKAICLKMGENEPYELLVDGSRFRTDWCTRILALD